MPKSLQTALRTLKSSSGGAPSAGGSVAHKSTDSPFTLLCFLFTFLVLFFCREKNMFLLLYIKIIFLSYLKKI